ncbi:MAG: LCP family protein, partial [Chloroflexota bacterium]
MPETRPPAPGAPRLLLLNAVFPGLGHLAAGRVRWALVLAAPMLVLLGAGTLVALTSNSVALAARAFDPAVLTALVVVQLLVLGWRLLALGAVRLVTPLRATATTVVAAAAALTIVVGPQLWLAGLTLDARDAATEVFAPVDGGGAWVPDATAPPVESDDPDFATQSPDASPDASPSATPSPSPTPEVPRVNVLLIGMDSGVGRNTALTDTMIVASLDPVGRTVSMASIPRDMVDVPLPDGRKFRGKINSLVSYVRWHPKKFPGAKDGQSVLAAAIGTLLQTRIDYWAQVNLPGFVSLVDSVGGVVVNVTDGFCDPRYDEYGVDGFGVGTGRYRMNGREALAYARVRKAAGESDFTRAARQQEVIAALRDRIVKGAFLDNPARFLRSLGQTISTNIRPGLIADYVEIASGIARKDTFRTVIRHPLVKSGYDERGSIQIPQVERIRAMAARLFTPSGVRPEGFETMPSAGDGPTKNAASSNDCGVKATPKPTPRPTAKPTAAPPATPDP